MQILLQNTGNYCDIDDEDFELINKFGRWHENDSGYAIKKTRISGKNVSIRMHALINKTPKGLHTDHIDGNKLNNRKTNLRTASAEMNSWNRHRSKPHKIYTNLPKGITFDKSRNQYVATLTFRKRFNNLKNALIFRDKGVDEL